MFVAAEAKSMGRGGIAAVVAATGVPLDHSAGDRKRPRPRAAARGTRAAARRRTQERASSTRRCCELDALVEPATRGDPMSPLRWTCKSTTRLAAELSAARPRASARAPCAELLHDLATACRPTARRARGRSHPDRDAQFQHINDQVQARSCRAGQPVISVDTKKKELVGDFKNGGREWRPKGRARAGPRARLHRSRSSGKAIPYGVYDIAGNAGLGQRRHRPRHGRVRGRDHPALVADDGRRALPAGARGC